MFKYRIGVFCLLICSILLVGYVDAKTEQLPLLGKVIYLDPGHGGTDPGAVYKDIHEADLNLELALKTQKKLESLGAIVYLTRYGDYDLSVPHAINRKRSDLSRRGNIINRSMCDIYISIHLNAEVSSAWHGAEAYYDDVNEKNKELAKIMQEALKDGLNSRRKMKKTSTMYLHKRIERPGILIEVGFISNPNDRYLLQQNYYQEKVANTITNGVINYFKKMSHSLF